jgi:pectate lyase
MKFARVLLSGVATVALGVTAAQALPVIPGAAGYGMDTPAGRGGTVYRVTNLNASGAGSLKACTDATGARVCVFEVSGSIRLTEDLLIRNGPITIAGQTAPSPGITIRGAALRIHGSNVLVQHIRVRPGDDLTGPDPENRDALKIEGTTSVPVTNVVIDHCTFSWALDEIASVWGPHDNITFSNNIFSEPLNDSFHPTKDGTGHLEPHGFGVIIDTSATGGRVTMVGNLFAHIVQRNPLSRARELVFVNNMVYNRSVRDLDLQSQLSRVTKSTLEGNVFLQGPSNAATTRPLYVRTTGDYTLYSGSKAYVRDVYAPDYGTTVDSWVVLTGGDLSTPVISTLSRPVWNNGLTVISTASNGVYNHLLANSGARPTDRDNTDRRIIDSVRTRSGQIINCVSADGSTRCQKNARGWAPLAQNRRTLTLPSNPNGVASNGYTNLENWLHSMGNTLSGVTSANSPSAPAYVTVR